MPQIRFAFSSVLLGLFAASSFGQGLTHHLTAAWDGGQPNFPTLGTPSMSADGRMVAFSTEAGNLAVPFDHNNWQDIYLRDLTSGTTQRISVGLFGSEADQASGSPTLSGDGRFVAFDSLATNLVQGDTNEKRDVFVADRQTGTIELVSLTPAGAGGNGDSLAATISADGRYVAFASLATDLGPFDPNSYSSIYVRDRLSGTTQLASITWQGQPSAWASANPSISADGRYLAFDSADPGMVPGNDAYWIVVLRDLQQGTTTNASPSWDGSLCVRTSARASISANGRRVAFLSDAPNLVPGDANGFGVDTLVYDAVTGLVELASISTSGQQVQQFFVSRPSLSQDGRFVTFQSSEPGIVPGDTNVFPDICVRDRLTATTLRASLASDGSQGDQSAQLASISLDGQRVAFCSSASNFSGSPGDFTSRVYLRELASTVPEVYCVAKPNSQGCTPAIGFTGLPSASAAAPFRIQASQVLNQKSGLLFYGLSFQSQPFQGAVLCVTPPLTRTSIQFAGGNPPPDDCSGFYSFDFNNHIQSGADPRLVSGTIVDAQYWTRDPADPTGFSTGLTDALHFLIAL